MSCFQDFSDISSFGDLYCIHASCLIFFSGTTVDKDSSLGACLHFESLVPIRNSTWLPKPLMYSDWLKFQKSPLIKL